MQHNRRHVVLIWLAAKNRKVHHGPRRLGDIPQRVADHADNFVGPGHKSHGDMLADGILAWEVLISKLLADNGVTIAIQPFLVGEKAAPDERYLHGRKVTGIDGARHRI